MINGVDYIGFFITFGGGFIVGMLMGIAVAVCMGKCEPEEVKEEVKHDCDNCHFNIDNEYCRFREKFPEEKICTKWKEDK